MSEFVESVGYHEGPERTDRSSHGAEGGPATMLGELADADQQARNEAERAEGLLTRLVEEIKAGTLPYDTALDFLNTHTVSPRSRDYILRALDEVHPERNPFDNFVPRSLRPRKTE